MANNALVGEIGMGTTFLGSLTSALSSFIGGIDQQEMYNYQAGVARLNAQIAEQNATYATQVGELQATRAGLQGGQLMGRIRAAQSASGLDINTGSAKQVQSSQREATGNSIAAIRSNAAKTAYNYRTEGVQYIAQAQLDTLAGRNARVSGMIGAASSVLGGASSVSSEWMRGQQLGLWSGGGSSSNSSNATAGGLY